MQHTGDRMCGRGRSFVMQTPNSKILISFVHYVMVLYMFSEFMSVVLEHFRTSIIQLSCV